MTNSRLLQCVGGPAHGQLLNLVGEYYRHPLLPESQPYVEGREELPEFAHKDYVEYRKISMWSPWRGAFQVLVSEDLGLEDAMEIIFGDVT